jgi:ornithine--oxo-acid transaminase
MPFDLKRLVAERATEKRTLFDRHLNAQLARVLRTIGFDADYVRAEGAYLFDRQGQRYLDLLSGFGVFSIGRNHPVVGNALKDVLDAGMPNLVQLDIGLLAGLLAEELSGRVSDLPRVFFCNSGTEAVEAAMKLARAATRRSKIVFCEHAFHGLTFGALSLNGDDMFREGFGPLLPECVRVPFDDLGAAEEALAGGDVAAFFVEPIQGKGVNLPSDDYLPELARLCRRHGTLLVADEIQTGLGRTGRFLAVEHWNVEPDIVLLAKALSGGAVPIGAVLMREWVFGRVFDRMDRAVVHGSTFAKNNLAMAAGLATLAVLDEEGLVERSAVLGARLIQALKAELEGAAFVKEVRGKGLMIGIEFGQPARLKLAAAWQLLDRANKGLFCQMITIPLYKRHRILSQVAGHGSHVVKLLPALVVDDDDCDWIVRAFGSVASDCERVPGAVWDLGRTLAGHALKARAGAA